MMFPLVVAPTPLKVLIWLDDQDSASGLTTADFDALKGRYENMGLTVHFDSTPWSGTLADYRLIHTFRTAADPSWWGEITGATWSGRIHMCSDASDMPDSNDWFNDQTAMTGITLVAGTEDEPGFFDGTVETDDLTDGQSVLRHGRCSTLTGGTALARTDESGDPWLAKNKVGDIDFVVSGDSSHATDFVAFDNRFFLDNLWTVTI